MRNLNNFETFRIGKSQMAKVSGGYVACQVRYTDGMGGSFVTRFNQASKKQAREALQQQHPDAEIDCFVL